MAAEFNDIDGYKQLYTIFSRAGMQYDKAYPTDEELADRIKCMRLVLEFLQAADRGRELCHILRRDIEFNHNIALKREEGRTRDDYLKGNI